MEEFDIYKDISERTGGDIYIGVVGPVRAGKSTFITKFMEKLVVPKVKGKHNKSRMVDELPQSANGKNIMTTQPKFVPSEAVPIQLESGVNLNVRLVDCVGYLIDGATGHMDGDKPRMVKTPWSDEDMPFEQAADIGTRKVIADHSTIGLVITTDGSIDTDIARTAYVNAEERVIRELRELGKPYIIILNSTVPNSAETMKLAESLTEKYDTAVIPMDVINMQEKNIREVFEKLLYEFPLRDIEITIDKWLRALPLENDVIKELTTTLLEQSKQMNKMSDFRALENLFSESERFQTLEMSSLTLGTGKIICNVSPRPELFYRVLSDECKTNIAGEFELMAMMKEVIYAKKEYDRLSAALQRVNETGYGVVTPTLDQMTLEEPEMVKQGTRYGVKLKASAPSLHIMRVDIKSEVSPIVGTEQQSEELMRSILSEFDNDPKSIWETNIFGKSLHMLVNEGLNNKLMAMPEDTQRKMRKTLSRIINEGKGGIICILL